MTAILSLPQYRATAGVGLLEDWTEDIVFLYADGSAIDLTGIGFTTSLTRDDATVATFSGSTESGAISIGGTGNNVLSILVPAAAKAAWLAGSYAWTLLATDGTRARAVFAGSTLRVGTFRALELQRLSSGVAASLTSASPAAVLAALMLTSVSDRRDLLNALISAAPNVAAGDAIPDAGLAYLNSSGFRVIAGAGADTGGGSSSGTFDLSTPEGTTNTLVFQ